MADLQLSRRQLVLGTAAASAVAVAWGSLGHIGRYPSVPPGVRVLTPKDVAVYQVVGDWIMPEGGGFPGSGGDHASVLKLEAFVAQMPPDKARWVHGLMALLEHGTAMDRFGRARLTALSTELVDDSLHRWSTSEVLVTQQLWHAFRSLMAFTYFDRPDVVATMGLGGVCS